MNFLSLLSNWPKIVFRIPQTSKRISTMVILHLKGSLQERVVLFHVTIRRSFFKTTKTFEAQVQ